MEQINAQRKKDARVEATPTTVLVGEGAALDSLLLLNFLVATEERLLEDHGLEIGLVDLIADAGDEKSPLKSIGTLAEHLVKTAGAS
jgi:hypothetical protein